MNEEMGAVYTATGFILGGSLAILLGLAWLVI